MCGGWRRRQAQAHAGFPKAHTSRGAKPDAPDRPLGTLPAAPTASSRGNGSAPSTGWLPLGMGSGTGPSIQQECLYAHSPRGCPAARLWPFAPLSGGIPPGQWQGAPHWCGAVARWHGTNPPRRCGCPWRRAQPGARQAPLALPSPQPGQTAAASQADRARRLTGDWLGWAPGRQDASHGRLTPPTSTSP